MVPRTSPMSAPMTDATPTLMRVKRAEDASYTTRLKRTNMKTISWLAVAFVVIATADAARQEPAPQPDAAATLITDFRADDWTRRAAAFEQLKRQPQILTLSRKKEILTEVVGRENHEIEDAFREGTGASDKYGESYSEYAATLAPYLLSIVDVQDVDAVVAVAQSEIGRASC